MSRPILLTIVTSQYHQFIRIISGTRQGRINAAFNPPQK